MCTHSNILFVSVRQRGVHQRIEHCKNNFGIQDHTHNLPSYCRTRYHNTRLTRRHRFLPYRDMSERSQSDPNLAGSHSDTYTIHFVPNECLPDKNVRLVRLTYTTLRSCLLGRCAAASAGRGTIHCNDRDDHMANDQDHFWHPNIRCCSPFRSSPFHRCIFHPSGMCHASYMVFWLRPHTQCHICYRSNRTHTHMFRPAYSLHQNTANMFRWKQLTRSLNVSCRAKRRRRAQVG